MVQLFWGQAILWQNNLWGSTPLTRRKVKFSIYVFYEKYFSFEHFDTKVILVQFIFQIYLTKNGSIYKYTSS